MSKKSVFVASKQCNNNDINYKDYNSQRQHLELSLEAQVFLAFKYKASNRLKLLDKLTRASIESNKQLTDKASYLSEKAKKLAKTIFQKIIKGENVLLNHKYISQATRCKSDQNANILKELQRIFFIKYYRSFTNNNGINLSRHYHITLHPAIVEELKDTGILNSQFYPEKILDTYNNNKNSFNKTIRSNESNFSKEEKNVELNKESRGVTKQQATIHALKSNNYRLNVKLANKRKKLTKTQNKAKKAKLLWFKQYNKPKNLLDHYPLTSADATELQRKSDREFSLNAQNQILLSMSKKAALINHRFCSKAQFMSYMAKALIYEKRDAVKTANENYRIKANLTEDQLIEHTTLAQREAYLAEIEDKAITHRNDETQFRAKLVGTLGPNLAYDILIHLSDFYKHGEVFEMIMKKDIKLTQLSKDIILSQVNAVGGYSGTERLEIVLIENKMMNYL